MHLLEQDMIFLHSGMTFAYVQVENLNVELRATLGSDVFTSGWQGGFGGLEDPLLPARGNGIYLSASYGMYERPIDDGSR